MSGRTLRLFLVDGTPSGLITAEIMNWTGHILAGPRSMLAEILKRPEVARTGIYFLIGPDPKSSSTRIYVGEPMTSQRDSSSIIAAKIKAERTSGKRPASLLARISTSPKRT